MYLICELSISGITRAMLLSSIILSKKRALWVATLLAQLAFNSRVSPFCFLELMVQ